MSQDRDLIDNIKMHFARKSSAQLREIMLVNNPERWSAEAIAAAGEVFNDRLAGRADEPHVAEEIFREMVRVYQRFRLQRDRDEMRWVENLIKEAKAEQATNPMSTEEMIAEDEELRRWAAKHAKKIGLKADLKSATRLIHEYRKARRSA